jgi:hypothetical protein
MVVLEKTPWPTLTLVVSREAIFLSTFVMIGQNRKGRRVSLTDKSSPTTGAGAAVDPCPAVTVTVSRAGVAVVLIGVQGLPSGGCSDPIAQREFPSDKVYRRDDRGIVGVGFS